MYIYEFACLTVPVLSVGFSSWVIRGNESEGTSHVQISWTASGCGHVSTYYYILPLMYKKLEAFDGAHKANFSHQVASKNCNCPAAAVEGIGIQETTLYCNIECYVFFILFLTGEDFVGDPIPFIIDTNKSSSLSGELWINTSLLIDDDWFEPKIEGFYLLLLVNDSITTNPLVVPFSSYLALFQILDNKDSK